MSLACLSSPVISSDTSTFPFKKDSRMGMEAFNVRKLRDVVPASRLEIRPAPAMTHIGIPELDLLTGGLPRGCLTEVCGPASSGRTSLLLATLAQSTQRNEICALVDVSDSFDPVSAHAAGVHFEKLLWIRCGNSPDPTSSTSATKDGKDGKKKYLNQELEKPVEQALRVTDLLLQSGGFGLVVIDLGDVSLKIARRIPLTSWFRFQRAIENTPTVLLVIATSPCTHTCASLLLKLRARAKKISATHPAGSGHLPPSHSQLLGGIEIEGELLRSRMQRKSVQSVSRFSTGVLRTG